MSFGNSDYFMQAKKKFKHEYASSINLQVVGSGAYGAPRSLYVFTEHCRYFFNCGEGTQRLAAEHKVKLSMMEHVLITHKSWENVGGLPGALLTMQDSGVPYITIHGPPGVESLYNDTRHFLRFNDLNISYSHYENYKVLKQVGSLLIQAVPLWSQNAYNGNPTSLPNQNSSDEVGDMFAHENIDKTQTSVVYSLKNTEESIKCKDLAIAYICRPVPKPGALLPNRCRELGVPVGPLMGELKKGNDVTLENGKVVKAADVTEAADNFGVFIVIEVPTKSHLADLVNCSAFEKHQEKGAVKSEDIACVLVHFSPVAVLNDPSYVEWINKFSTTTKHIYINENSRCMGSEGVHKIQYKLNHLFPDSFALLHDSERYLESKIEYNSAKRQKMDSDELDLGTSFTNEVLTEIGENENHQQAFTCLTYHIRPKFGFDLSKKVEINKEEYIKESYAVEGFNSVYESVNEKIESIKLEIDRSLKEQVYPNILFLGTGSCIPNKTRNTSGIALNISSTSTMLLDCGEGTLGQLVRYMGGASTDLFLRKLSVIYISHLHADHHIGLIRLLLARKRSFKKILISKEQVPTLMLLAPSGIIHYLTSFSENFEPLLDQFNLLPNHCLRLQYTDDKIRNQLIEFCEKFSVGIKDLETCFVHHCPNSFGVALVLKNGWKLAYSGDTMPCQDFVNIGRDSDLLIHEATMEDELIEDAKLKRHSTTSEAIEIGEKMKAKHIILTHFSQRYAKVPLLDQVPHNVGVAFDNMQICLWNLPCLPHLYPAYVKIFSEDFDEMLKKRMKIKNKKCER